MSRKMAEPAAWQGTNRFATAITGCAPLKELGRSYATITQDLVRVMEANQSPLPKLAHCREVRDRNPNCLRLAAIQTDATGHPVVGHHGIEEAGASANAT